MPGDCEKGTPVDFMSCMQTFLADIVLEGVTCNKCGGKCNFVERKRFLTYPTVFPIFIQRQVLVNWVPRKLEIEIQLPGG